MSKFIKNVLFRSISLLLIAGMYSCQSSPANQEEVIPDEVLANLQNMPSLSVAEGTRLLQLNCYTCHNPQSASHDEMLAPPLAGIKHKYLQLYPDREVFIHRLAAFTKYPSAENAVMRGPVRRFGMMPASTLPLGEIQQIAAYIYDHELPVPSWFPAHFEEQHGESW